MALDLSATEIQDALATLMRDEYDAIIYCWSSMSTVHVKLSKKTRSQAEVQVEGSGSTFGEAFLKALDNFPRHPVDGTPWYTKRLEPPKESGAVININQNGEEVPF